PSLEIIGATVLVAEIIGVLPHVVAEQDTLAIHHRRVLVRPRFERELAGAVDGDEHPAGAEHAQARRAEIGLERFQSARTPIDRRTPVVGWLAAARPHDLP